MPIVESKKLTYSLYFLVLLILSKCIYLFLESGYNYDVLKAVNDYAVTQADLENIEIKGHLLSSIGLSLLIIPLIYIFVKRFVELERNVFIFTMGIFTILTITFYNLLTFAMEQIVERNSDKRYESYYTGLLKYGILSGKLGYEKFIHKNNDIQNDTTSTVLISNIFLLSFIDKDVVDRVQREGKNAIVDLYIEKVLDKQYDKDRNEFLTKSEQIKQAWEKYNDGKNKINEEFRKFTNTTYVESEYYKFKDEMNKKYDKYSDAKIKFANKREQEHLKIDEYYNDLKRYFRYKGNSTAENKYRNSMNTNFQKYIEPSRWCYQNTCPTKEKIRNVIDEELILSWNKEVGLPLNIVSQKSFLKYPKIRNEVINKLRKNGLNVNDNFNYSSTHFYEAYNLKINKEHKNAVQKFKKEFESKTGIKNIDINLNWNQFVKLFEKEFIEKFDSEKYGKRAISLITTKELNRFYNDLYRPFYFDLHFKDIFYSRDDFLTDELAKERGDKFIKMLYIPPFALFMSLFAGILNLLSVIIMIAFLPFEQKNTFLIKITKVLLKVVLLLIVFFIVYTEANEKNYIENNQALKLINFEMYPKLNIYVKSLNSIIYLEDLNKKLQLK